MTHELELQEGLTGKRTFPERIRRFRSRYAASFTVHGLSHVVEGNIFEKIFWLFCIAGALFCTVFITYQLLWSFLNHEVNTSIKIVPHSRVQLPTIYVCAANAIAHFKSYRNCSSRRAESYDRKVCGSLTQRCPDFCPNGQCAGTNPNALPITCPLGLHGQCIAVNGNGKTYQTFSQSSIPFTLPLKETSLPVRMYVKPPGVNSSVISLLYDDKFTEINRLGLYDVTVEKTTLNRYPPPYSDCVTQRSKQAKSKNMFKGNYSMKNCISTCQTRRTLNECNTTYWSQTNLLKQQTNKRPWDKRIHKIHSCAWELSPSRQKQIDKCSDECKPPCYDQTFKATVRYQTADADQALKFNFKMQMNEVVITETARSDIVVVLSNFGGTLGLLAGVSALSVIELFVYLVLYLAEVVARCCCCCGICCCCCT